MKIASRVFGAAALYVLVSTPVLAGDDFQNATWLHIHLGQFIRSATQGTRFSPEDMTAASDAFAYTIGVADGVNGIWVCLPANSTQGQVASVVDKYLADNPEKWSLGSPFLITFSLKQAFPCPKK